MKKGWLLAVLLAASLILAGCGGPSAQPQTKTAQPTQAPAGITIPEDVYSVPDGTLIIDGNDYQTCRADMQKALNDRRVDVCVKDYIPFTWDDFYAMEYGTFWLEGYSRSDPKIGRLEGEDKRSSLVYYRFNYYDLTDSDIARMKGEIDAAVREIAAMVPEGADIWHQVRIVHDELIRRASYDHTLQLPHCHDAYGALVTGQAVCSGYASAFTAVMAELGQYCPIVVSDTHAWNRVNERTYQEFIDVTWDDPDMKDASGRDYIQYTYFGLTREEVESVDAHSITGGNTSITNWVADPVAFNYCDHEGYTLSSYDEKAASQIFKTQLKAGENTLMIRFINEEDYARAAAWWDGDGSAANRILTNAGLSGSYRYWLEDTLKTIVIGTGA